MISNLNVTINYLKEYEYLISNHRSARDDQIIITFHYIKMDPGPDFSPAKEE